MQRVLFDQVVVHLCVMTGRGWLLLHMLPKRKRQPLHPQCRRQCFFPCHVPTKDVQAYLRHNLNRHPSLAHWA